MTNTEPSLQPIGGSSNSFVQIPVWLIDYILTLKLSGTQYALLLYLWTIDPYGDRWHDIPPPEEIAAVLNVDARTVQRAAQRLQDCELFELQIKRWRVRNTTLSARSPDFPPGKGIQMRTKRSKSPKVDLFVQNRIKMSENGQMDPNVGAKAAQGKGSGTLHTIHTDPDSSDLPEKEREAGETASPVENVPEECFELTGEDSLKITTAYREWLRSKAQKLPAPPVLIEQWIASESLKATNQRQFLQEMRRLPQEANIPPPQPSRFQIETAIASALMVGDRPNALARLQGLWRDGQQDLVMVMVQEFPQWGFVVQEEGVTDADG